MSFVTSEKMLLDAQKGGYAVGAFNVENMEMVMAIAAAAEECRSPVIIQTTPGTLKHAPCSMFSGMVRAAAERAAVPIALHLDHGSSFALAAEALRSGYTSVMIDGSKLPFEENVALSARVAELGHACGVAVEAELGRVGGKEDGAESGGAIYTDPAEAAEFIERTGTDLLAVGIGTSHGVYKGPPRIALDVLERIHAAVSIPLVMHGTSGVPDDTVRRAIALGICKVNYATDLRIAYTDGVRDFLSRDAAAFDPKKYGAAGMEHVRERAARYIDVCGSRGRA